MTAGTIAGSLLAKSYCTRQPLSGACTVTSASELLSSAMKFRIGSIPDTLSATPDGCGWAPIHGTSTRQSKGAAYGYAIGALITFLCVVVGWGYLASDPWDGSTFVHQFPPLTLLGYIVGTVVIHEALHLACHPGFGLSDRSLLGYEKTLGLYVLYLDVLSRERLLVAAVAPTLLLSVVPAFLMSVFPGLVSGKVVLVAAINLGLSLADIYSLAFLALNLPVGAELGTFNGMTWWRPSRTVAQRS